MPFTQLVDTVPVGVLSLKNVTFARRSYSIREMSPWVSLSAAGFYLGIALVL